MFFGVDGGYTLREFKKFFKIEMEENPERYTFNKPPKSEIASKSALDKIRKGAEGEGPIFADVDQDRLNMLASLRDSIDRVAPRV